MEIIKGLENLILHFLIEQKEMGKDIIKRVSGAFAIMSTHLKKMIIFSNEKSNKIQYYIYF